MSRKDVFALPTAQQKKLAQQVIKLRKAGKKWPEICEATGIPGGITGRRLMREYGGASAEALIKPRANASQDAKAAK